MPKTSYLVRGYMVRGFIPFIAVIGVACAAVLGINLHNPDAVIGKSYGRVLLHGGGFVQAQWQPAYKDAAHRKDLAQRSGLTQGSDFAQNSNLTQGENRADRKDLARANIVPALNTQAPPLQNLLSVGDQIMLTQPDRSKNSFRILNVELLNDTVTRIDTSLAPTRYLLITAQDMTQGAAQNTANNPEKIIRFVLDIGSMMQTDPAASRDQIL